MIKIAHRGNTIGPNPDKENRTDHILNALNQGFQVEIDVWYENKQWWMGHDEPKWKTGINIFENAWLHAKNKEALEKLKSTNFNYFWQDNDAYTITSKGYIWCHKDSIVLPDSICLMPELGFKGDIKKCYGVCSDYVENKLWKS